MSYTYNKCQRITAYNDNLNVICRMPEHIILTEFGEDAITKPKICATIKKEKIVEKREKKNTVQTINCMTVTRAAIRRRVKPLSEAWHICHEKKVYLEGTDNPE